MTIPQESGGLPAPEESRHFLQDYFLQRQRPELPTGVARRQFAEEVAGHFDQPDPKKVEHWIEGWAADGLILLRRELERREPEEQVFAGPGLAA